jgi:hypothetical protein
MIQSHTSYSRVFGLLALAAGIFFGTAVTYSSSVAACTLANWPDSSSATGQACDPVAGCPRFQGQCSYKANAGATDFVVHGGGANGADGTAQEFSNRFYVLLNSLTAGNVTVFRAVNGATAVITLTVQSGNPKQFVLTSDALTIGPVNAASGWNEIQINRNASNAVSLTVNGVVAPGAGTGSSVAITNAQLGSVVSAGGVGQIYFDSYVANRTTAPVALVNCDGSNDGNVNIIDASVIASEAVGGALSNGTPDCNSSGGVNIIDASITACIAVGGTSCQ